ncbi:MAG: hypothetical protein LAO51_04540 [Acidobacteriia bacterium]|nr:hypothetical protein [Terriglobia bacterium]
MATQQALDRLTAIIKQLDDVDREKLLRRNLGEESIEKAIGPGLEQLDQVKHFVVTYAQQVHDSLVEGMRGVLEGIRTLLATQAARPNVEYLSQRQVFLTEFARQLEDTKVHMPGFVTAAIVERGFLEDEGIRREYEKTVTELKRESAATLAAVKEEAEKAVAGAKELADQIEQRARRTAAKISLKEAQEQFTSATVDLSGKIKLWARWTLGALGLLVVVPLAFMLWPLPKGEAWPVALYHTLLRMIVLSAAAGFSTFCLRMLRAHIHMSEKNKHRVRVANSVESFVNSAVDPQQRDLILAKLAEAIVDFGDSGLIRHEHDDTGSPALSGDTIGRILSALSSRK